MTTFLSVAAFLAVLVLFAAFRWWAKRSRYLPPAQATVLWKHFAAAEAQTDPHRKVLDAAKTFESALKAKGYRGSLGDMLRRAGPAIPSVQSVWDGVKLRNRLAHEPGAQADAKSADRAAAAFGRALAVFLGPRP